MGFFELFLIAVGLSMDAFAVSVCTGLSLKRVRPRHAITVGLYFGIFQGVMPLIGYLVGTRFSDYVVIIDHWIAFVFLSVIGGKMIIEGFKKSGDSAISEMSLSPKELLPLAIATSIDALAVGISFAFLQVDIIPAVGFIGLTTLALSAIGVYIGNAFGMKLKSKAEIFGGAILVIIGLKILLEHLGIIAKLVS